jgi:hypothetical protein
MAISFNCSDIRGNRFDRCHVAIYSTNLGNSVVAGNVISGTTGPATPAPIQSMTWSGGVTTVNTVAPHNIPNGSTIQLVNINPLRWVPTPNVITQPNPPDPGNGFVTITVDNATRFHYSGPSSAPPPFVSGSWNWPIQYGMLVPGCSHCTFAANVISAVSTGAGFSLDYAGLSGWNNAVMAMMPPRGWTVPPAGHSTSYKPHINWNFLACTPGSVGDNPLRFIHVADLIAETSMTRPYNSFNVVDAQVQHTFGHPVFGGGTSCYKVRHDGANWVRVG